ncbi:hypothetical protein KW882_01665 [Vibrio parahaemolyticus]
MSEQKMITIPVNLRVMVNKDTPAKELEALINRLTEGDFPIVESSGDLESELVKAIRDHHDGNSDFIKDADLWSAERDPLSRTDEDGEIIEYDFHGIIDEQKGGIIGYVREDIAEDFVSYLAWFEPTMNFDVDSVDHPEWDGWATRGWSLDTSTMEENLELVKKYNSDIESSKGEKAELHEVIEVPYNNEPYLFALSPYKDELKGKLDRFFFQSNI